MMDLYAAYRIGQFLVLKLPLRFSYWLASRFSDLRFATAKKDRNLIINNIKTITGKDGPDARRIARQVFRNFAKYLIEFLRFEKMGDEYIKRHVRIEGAENIKSALKLGKGAVLFSAHLGNWEWAGALIAHLGFSLKAIVLTHKDKRIDDFFTKQRMINGMGSIPLGGSVRKCLKQLDANGLIAIVSDRDFSNNSIDATFFGKTAHMPVGTAILAMKKGCPLIPCFIVRQKNDKHVFFIDKPIEYKAPEDNDAAVKEIVQRVTDVIEKYVRKYPEQWFMFENPWERKGTKCDSV